MKWSHIIIHHSESKDNRVLDWQNIRKWHTDKGWQDIGYHFGIEKINDQYEILVGRPLILAGAHTEGMNKTAIGICCVGNYDIDVPEQNMYIKLKQLLIDLQIIFNIPDQNIKLHRDYSDKTCPGKYFDLARVV
jgi:N-acetylmuramoyl-L-alanine amidase